MPRPNQILTQRADRYLHSHILCSPSFSHSFVSYALIFSFSRSLILSFSHSLVLSSAHSLILSLPRCLILSFCPSIILSFSLSLILSFPHSLVLYPSLDKGHILRGSACFAKRRASMRDEANMSLLCIDDAMLVICCIRRFPPHCDCVGKVMGRHTCLCIFMPSHDVFLE